MHCEFKNEIFIRIPQNVTLEVPSDRDTDDGDENDSSSGEDEFPEIDGSLSDDGTDDESELDSDLIAEGSKNGSEDDEEGLENSIFPREKRVKSGITGRPKRVFPPIEPEYDSDSSTEDVSPFSHSRCSLRWKERFNHQTAS